ncbi:MAG TPA: hypothetical protein VMS17_23680 [Gemmataceae bacterium]|nr:hypothetical protein [Gemmataceae bacterium]
MTAALLDFVEMPSRWTHRPWAWQQLTADDALYRRLVQAVHGHGCDWRRLRLQTVAWAVHVEHAEVGRLRPQWMALRRLLWCAEQAATVGRPPLFVDLPDYLRGHESWAWGCIRSFLRPAVRATVTVPVPLLDRDPRTAFVARLQLEVLEDGRGEVFPHPADAFASEYDPVFVESLRDAWTAACGLVRRESGGADGCDGRFRLLRDGRPVADVSGPSAGGAAVRGWRLALCGKTLHDHAVVLARLRTDPAVPERFRLAGVGGVRPKTKAAVEEGACAVIVAPTKEDKREAGAVLKELGRGRRVRVRLARSLDKLIGVPDREAAQTVAAAGALGCFGYTMRALSTEEEFGSFWDIDKAAYEDVDQREYELHMRETLHGWWTAFPAGLLGLFRGGQLLGGLGVWPLSAEIAMPLKDGRLRERDLSGAAMQPFRDAPAASWYIGGIVLKPQCRRTGAVWPLVHKGFPSWIRTCRRGMAFPLELLALGASDVGVKLLEDHGFTRLCPASAMPDGLPLYVRRFDSEGELEEPFF